MITIITPSAVPLEFMSKKTDACSLRVGYYSESILRPVQEQPEQQAEPFKMPVSSLGTFTCRTDTLSLSLYIYIYIHSAHSLACLVSLIQRS